MVAKSLIVAASSLVVLFIASTAQAQNQVYVFEEETIQGSIEKPEAFYILSPSSLNYESVPAEETFLPELYDTLEESSF